MGRNAASRVHWTHATDDLPKNIFTHYCQQHAAWKRDSDVTLSLAFGELKTHLETTHGNVEQ